MRCLWICFPVLIMMNIRGFLLNMAVFVISSEPFRFFFQFVSFLSTFCMVSENEIRDGYFESLNLNEY